MYKSVQKLGAGMDAVHREAADFLSGLWKQRQADRVIIGRQQAPRYLVGFKASGAAVWAHNQRLARKFLRYPKASEAFSTGLLGGES